MLPVFSIFIGDNLASPLVLPSLLQLVGLFRFVVLVSLEDEAVVKDVVDFILLVEFLLPVCLPIFWALPSDTACSSLFIFTWLTE